MTENKKLPLYKRAFLFTFGLAALMLAALIFIAIALIAYGAIFGASTP